MVEPGREATAEPLLPEPFYYCTGCEVWVPSDKPCEHLSGVGARCAACSAPLPERPADVGGQPRVFCSARCRKTAWRRAHGQQPRSSSLDTFAVYLREREADR